LSRERTGDEEGMSEDLGECWSFRGDRSKDPGDQIFCFGRERYFFRELVDVVPDFAE
jgi:hypothetical protein